MEDALGIYASPTLSAPSGTRKLRGLANQVTHKILVSLYSFLQELNSKVLLV